MRIFVLECNNLIRVLPCSLQVAALVGLIAAAVSHGNMAEYSSLADLSPTHYNMYRGMAADQAVVLLRQGGKEVRNAFSWDLTLDAAHKTVITLCKITAES